MHALLLPLLLVTQPPALVPVPTGAACTSELRMITVRVRRGDGTPVTDADVRTRDARTGRTVHRTHEPLLGGAEYVAVQDGDLKLRADGVATLSVEARWRGQRRAVRVRVRASDAAGCHLERVGAPVVLTFP